MQLDEETTATIKTMDKRLKHLETLLDEALSKETPESLTAWILSKRTTPAEPKEEYVRCIDSGIYSLKNNQVYIVEREDGEYYTISTDQLHNGEYKKERFVSATKSEYLAQQGEKEWKEGEWFNSALGELFLCEMVGEIKLCGNNQNGGIAITPKSLATKPTPEEVGQWLTSIAEKKYPVGTKVKTITGTFLISSHEFKYNKDNNSLLALIRNGGEDYYKTVWNLEDKWAEVSEPTVDSKERWKPKSGEEYWYIDFNVHGIDVKTSVNWGALVNTTHLKENNCFQTKELGNLIADKIRNLLSNTNI